MVRFLLKRTFIATKSSCYAPRFPPTASCYKNADSQTSFMLCWGSESNIQPPTPQPCLEALELVFSEKAENKWKGLLKSVFQSDTSLPFQCRPAHFIRRFREEEKTLKIKFRISRTFFTKHARYWVNVSMLHPEVRIKSYTMYRWADVGCKGDTVRQGISIWTYERNIC